MFVVNEDKSIYCTRGDSGFFSVFATDDGESRPFEAGEVVRFTVYVKKNASNVVLQKDFPVTETTESVEIILTEKDTKIGETISKPTDYWYEVELNPFTDPQTIIGYNEEGAKIFKLFPEGRDLDEDEPDIDPEDIPIVDEELDLTSHRPVENQAIARAVAVLSASERETSENLATQKARLDNLLSGATVNNAELLDVRVTDDGTTYANAGESVREQFKATLRMRGLVDWTNYQSKLPDANYVLEAGVYALHFEVGSTSIPANLPFSAWEGRTATLITIKNNYFRQLYIDDKHIFTRNGTCATESETSWSSWKCLNGKATYTIDVNGGGDYTTILQALKDHPTNTRFIVNAGTYDIASEYMSVYGDDYFADYEGYRDSTDVMDRGLFLGDGVEIIGVGNVDVVFRYYGNNAVVKEFFSVFSTSQNNVIDNINISINDGSCRYMIHDDYATAPGHNVFRNIHFKGRSFLSTAIGSGFGTSNTYLIVNCVFTDIGQSIAIAYHNNEFAGKCKLTIRDCYCDGSIALKHYGASTEESIVVISNCFVTDIDLRHLDATAFPNENMELIEWNNTK